MDMHSPQPRRFPAVPIVTVLLLLCIYPGQYWITSLLPEIPALVKVRPSLVFLEIPMHLSEGIDLLLVLGLFLLIYPVVILMYPSRAGIPSLRYALQKAGAAFTGLVVLLICTLSGGFIYYLVQDSLPGNIRNGINSFGMNADIYLPYPGYETIHLRGSTMLFIGFVAGMMVFIRKVRKEPGIQQAGRLTREQRMTPYERIVQEKRVKEKQTLQEARIQQNAAVVTKPAANRVPAAPEQRAERTGRSSRPAACCTQPVGAFRPEAVGYMPML